MIPNFNFRKKELPITVPQFVTHELGHFERVWAALLVWLVVSQARMVWPKHSVSYYDLPPFPTASFEKAAVDGNLTPSLAI